MAHNRIVCPADCNGLLLEKSANIGRLTAEEYPGENKVNVILKASSVVAEINPGTI